jgi:uroporphyrinogen-III decarboxylase
MGAITEISDQFDYTYIRAAKDFVTRKWHKFPVSSRQDWEENMKWRYASDTPGRFPADLAERGARLRERDYVSGIHFNGPFWQLREWLGFENLCLLMAEDPAFAEELAGFWTEFVSQILERVLEHFSPDYAMISEDMAYKMHSMISPAMTRHFLGPSYQRWVPQLKAGGCPLVCVDSDGFIGELIPLWIEYGIHCTAPVEVAAGNDLVAFRQRWGRQMAYTGGLDKRALAAGGATMQAEVMRVVPPLLRQGGYIPGCDHGVPPDISWPNYIAYSRLLAQLTGWL